MLDESSIVQETDRVKFAQLKPVNILCRRAALQFAQYNSYRFAYFL